MKHTEQSPVCLAAEEKQIYKGQEIILKMP